MRSRRNPEGYGRKGGASPNRGNTFTSYRFTMPDGRVMTKRSFRVRKPVAVAMISEHDGVWHFNSIQPKPENFPRQTWVPAERVEKT